MSYARSSNKHLEPLHPFLSFTKRTPTFWKTSESIVRRQCFEEIYIESPAASTHRLIRPIINSSSDWG